MQRFTSQARVIVSWLADVVTDRVQNQDEPSNLMLRLAQCLRPG